MRWSSGLAAQRPTSDIAHPTGYHGIWGKGNGTWPLNLWENSVRVPAIISQPGRLGVGALTDALASACDLHPTLLNLAGVPVPEDPLAAGLSLVPVLTGKAGTGREAVLVCQEYGGVRGVRTADWKYVSRARDGPRELYDLCDDPDERSNLASEPAYRARRNELDAVLHDWFTAHVDRARDGFRRPVSGRGQLQPVTFGADDASTYYQGEEERRVPGDADTSTVDGHP